jgi:hypothetical protein
MRDDRLPERRRAAETADEEEVAAVAVDMHGDLGAVLEAQRGGGHGRISAAARRRSA